MPPKKGAAKKGAPVVSDDMSDSLSTSSGSVDEHISPSPPAALTAKGSKGFPKRMGSTLSDGVTLAGGPPAIQYVNQLAIDEEIVLSTAEEREDVEGFCRNLVEDLADMVQESIYASLMDRMAVPWTVQEVILELYMGMYFSVVDRDVEFPPALDEGGRTLAEMDPKELFTLCDSEEFPHHSNHGGAPDHPSLSQTQGGLASTTTGSPTFGSGVVSLTGAGSGDTALPTGPGSAAGPHLPADFYCKFDPVSFGERNPEASIEGTSVSITKPMWASTNTASGVSEIVEDDWSTDVSTDEGSPSHAPSSSNFGSSMNKKRPEKDQPSGFIIVQKKLRKKQATATKLGIAEGPGGRSSPTAIRRQRVMNTPKNWDLNGTTLSNGATPSGASLSLSQADGCRTPPRNPEETGRLVECVRAVSTKERVELESRLLHFQRGGDGSGDGGDGGSLSSSASLGGGGQMSLNTPAPTVAPAPSKIGGGGAPPTILKRSNTGKPSGASSATSVVRIVSRANSEAPAVSDPHDTSTDPLAGIRRVLSNADDNTTHSSSTTPPFASEDPFSRTSSGRKGTGTVLAEKRSAAALNSPASLNSVHVPFATERSGSIEIEINSPVRTPPPKHGARRLSISATGQISSFRPSQGPQRRAGGQSGSPITSEIPPIVGVNRAISSSSVSTAVPSTTTSSRRGVGTGKKRQPKKKVGGEETSLRNLRDNTKASHYFYRDPLLGPQWSDVFLSVPEPPHIPPDSWSRGLLPSRRPIISELDATSLFLGNSLANTTIMRGSSRGGARSGSGRERSASPQANGPNSRFNASTASTDDVAGSRRRSSLLVPTTTTGSSSRPASRAASNVGRPASRNRAVIPKPSTTTTSPTTTPTDASSLADKKIPTKTATTKTASKTKGSAPKTPPPSAIAMMEESDELLPLEGGPKSQLALLQRLELSEDDLKIQREEQRVKDRMAQLRNTSEDINRQLAALKPKTPFTVDLKSGTVLVQKRPEGVKMDPVPGSICGGPTVLGGKRITTPEEEHNAMLNGAVPPSPLDQLLEEQLRIRSQAAIDKNNPKTRRAQTAPIGSGTSPTRGDNNNGSQVIRIVEDLEEERRQRAELTAQLEKLDLKELKDASTAQEAINASIGGVSSIAGGGSPPRTRPGTAVEMDNSQRRPRGKKLPPTNFYEVEKRVETPMIAKPISPVGGVMSKVGDVISVTELTIPTVAPNGGRPMSRSEFTRLQQGNSSQGVDPNDAKDTAAYWQGELSGASRIAPRAAATGGGGMPPRPNSTPLTLGNPSTAAAARSESATPLSGVRQPKGLVQRLSSAVTKQGINNDEDGDTGGVGRGASSSGGVRGLLDRARTTDPTIGGSAAKRAFTPMSKQRKGVYVPPAHRVSSQSGIGTSTSPSRGRIGTPTSIVELA